MIRAKDQAIDFVVDLTVSNPVVYAPMVEIEPMNMGVVPPNSNILIFTSANAVGIYSTSTQDRNNSVVCVGSVTHKAAENVGFTVQNNFETTELLINFFQNQLVHNNSIFYARAETVSQDLTQILTDMGYTISDMILYRQQFLPLSQVAINLIESSLVAVPILSTEIARQFRDAIVPCSPHNLILICISSQVAAIFKGLSGFKVEIATKPTRVALIDKIKDNITA